VHRPFHEAQAVFGVTSPAVTLQINLSPGDWRHASLLLPHQMRAWRAQVSEVLLVIDLHRSSGRFAAGWEEGRDRILTLARSIDGARVETVDYGDEARARVSSEFFGNAAVPQKDFRGGPYYAYFFGLNAARNDFVFHVDSDIFFGGGSQTWIAEAIRFYSSHGNVLVMAPLPGPPSADGSLRQLHSLPDSESPHSHLFEEMSTRLFLLDRARFRTAVGALAPTPPASLRSRIKALVEGNPSADLPEHLFTRKMRERGLVRRDFLGDAPGMWSLHPPYRCADFYKKLPGLVARIEAGEVPDAQKGDHDINGSLVDWSEALDRLARNRWWRRLFAR
jgi:hypothetical protein